MIMSMKDILLDQLALCRNEESWIKPLSMALDGLNVKDALWKESEDSHSIAEITSHLSFYNERWLKRFYEEEVSPPVENASTFTAENFDEENWQGLLAQLDAGLANWQKAVRDMPEAKLYEPIPTFPEDALWWGALSNLCTHNTYHIGQIIYIRKVQGSWNKQTIIN
jgi:uncharacterized damage-inducible protein DinB